jgi:hypothetical protein
LDTIWENFQCDPLDFYADDIPPREAEIMFGENWGSSSAEPAMTKS